MAKFLFVAGGSARNGEEDEYSSWYEDVHLPAVLGVDGFVAATRYRSVPTSTSQSPYDFLTMYEVEAPSAEEAHAALLAAAKGGALGSTESSDRSRSGAWFFEAVGTRRTP